ncbi:MAG: anion permease [Clostridia bacterium]|nr:anion permease [Clostridia bacterium]
MGQATIISLIIFAATYVLMLAFQKARPYIVLASAAIFVLIGTTGWISGFSYSFVDAVSQIDWNVLMMIAGTMGLVYLFIESKMPQLISDVLISKVPDVRAAVIVLSLFAGIISAFVDNVATVIMIAPVAISFCKKLNISPVPAIICIAISSNLQGAATLVGDTTSILLGKAANLDFFDFFWDEGRLGMFFVVQLGAIAATLVIAWLFRKQNQKIDMHERTEVKDKVPTVLLLLAIATLIAASFIPYKSNAAEGQFYKPEITNGLICMFYFIVGLVYKVIKTKKFDIVKNALKEIDYYTIVLLAGLFIVIGGITEAGVIDWLGQTISKAGGSGGSVFLVYTIIVWASVLLSAFVDNIPYTATMLPVVAVIANTLSTSVGSVNPKLLYYGLLVGATLGGNLTPIGASANIAGIGILRKGGYEVKSGEFMKYGIPITLAAVVTGYLLVWAIWS